MKPVVILACLLASLSTPALVALQTVTLVVSGMTCATCPFTVKTALNRVDGVAEAEVSYKKREAVVIFDDSQTSTEALTEATASAGYPSSIKNADVLENIPDE